MWMLAGVCWALGIGISSAFSVVGFQHVKQPRMIFRAQVVCNLNGIEKVGPSEMTKRRRSEKISWIRMSNIGGQREAVERRRRRRRRGKDLLRNEEGVPVEPCNAPRATTYRRTTLKGAQRRQVGKVKAQGTTQSNVNSPNKLRILGGSSRGRKLQTPNVFLRPMMGKVKEALFNGLFSIGAMDGPNVSLLDVYSGSGSIGVEALSRGAKHVTFVDISKECCEISLSNAALCGFTTSNEQIPITASDYGTTHTIDGGSVTSIPDPSESSICPSFFLPTKAVRGHAMDVLYNPIKYDLLKPYDIITLTPPYEEVTYGDLVQAVAETPLAKEADTIIALEYPVELGCFPHVMADGSLIGLRNRRYGRTVLALYICRPSGRFESAISRPEEFVKL